MTIPYIWYSFSCWQKGVAFKDRYCILLLQIAWLWTFLYMNREAQVHKYIHMSELTRPYTMHIFTCKIFQSGYMKIILPPVNYACPHCSWSLPTLNIIINFNFCHFRGYILVSLCGFNLSISNQQWSLAGFHMCNGYLNFLFLKYLLSICSFSIDRRHILIILQDHQTCSQFHSCFFQTGKQSQCSQKQKHIWRSRLTCCVLNFYSFGPGGSSLACLLSNVFKRFSLSFIFIIFICPQLAGWSNLLSHGSKNQKCRQFLWFNYTDFLSYRALLSGINVYNDHSM